MQEQKRQTDIVYTIRSGPPYGGKVLLTKVCRDLGMALMHAEGLAAVEERKHSSEPCVTLSWIKNGRHHTVAVYKPLDLDETTGEIKDQEQQDMFAAKM